MLLGLVIYIYIYIYKFVIFCLFFFFQKAESNRLKNDSWAKLCNFVFA